MSTAILTIDDVASANTPAIVDYLVKKKIKAVMFGVGMNIEKFYNEAVYAVKKGMILGNHSYSHIHFSETPFEQCVEEIEKTEMLLDKLYAEAGVPRAYRPFRFPYGDRGFGKDTAHYEALQSYLRSRGFSKLCDRNIPFLWYSENNLDRDISTHWTFDFEEYRICEKGDFTVQSVYGRIHDEHPVYGGVLLEEGSHHIVLIHAFDETEAVLPRYYEQFLDYVQEQGVCFVDPEFHKMHCDFEIGNERTTNCDTYRKADNTPYR